MVIIWSDVGEVLLKTVILAKFRMCFFNVTHYFGHISGMVGPIDVKRTGSASVQYWAQCVTLTFDHTLDLDLGYFKVKFWNSSVSGIVGLIDVKWKGSELIWYWADCMKFTLDHTHDLDLGVSRSASEIAISQEWGGWLTLNENDVSHHFMTMMLTTSVTMVWWADVLGGGGDNRRAVDIYSWCWTFIHTSYFQLVCVCLLQHSMVHRLDWIHIRYEQPAVWSDAKRY